MTISTATLNNLVTAVRVIPNDRATPDERAGYMTQVLQSAKKVVVRTLGEYPRLRFVYCLGPKGKQDVLVVSVSKTKAREQDAAGLDYTEFREALSAHDATLGAIGTPSGWVSYTQASGPHARFARNYGGGKPPFLFASSIPPTNAGLVVLRTLLAQFAQSGALIMAPRLQAYEMKAFQDAAAAVGTNLLSMDLKGNVCDLKDPAALVLLHAK